MSNETKFTESGTWKLCGAERGGCQCMTVNDNDGPVAKIECGKWGDTYPAILLEALETFVKASGLYLEFEEVGVAYEKANAIAKARGGAE